MRVALVVPSSNLKINRLVAPLNLGYIAGYLREIYPNVVVKVIDGALVDDVLPLVVAFNPDVVGVTVVTPLAPSAYRLMDKLRMADPSVFLVAGGVHVTQLPYEALEHCDCVVTGEGELAFADIVGSRLSGLPIAKIVEGKPVEDLDMLPLPAYDLLNMTAYLKAPPSVPNLSYPTVGLVTSRGCPFRCRFCWNAARGFKVRYFSAERIVEEILFLKEKFGVNSIFFNDDEFLINKARVARLAELFKEKGIDRWLRWGCQSRARTVTVELLKTVKAMGCVAISVGFESGCERVLDYLKAGSASVADNLHALKVAELAGVDMGGSFILGTPGETEAEIMQTVEWCWGTQALKYYGFTVLTPYPGTPVWNDCVASGVIDVGKVDYEFLIPPISPSDNLCLVSSLSRERFFKLYRRIHRMTWLNLAVRKKPRLGTFFGLMFTRSWWILWVIYPKWMFRTFVFALKGGI